MEDLMQLGRLLAMVAAAALLACSGGGSPSEPGDAGDSGPTVAVRNNLFDPAALEVRVNSAVTWAWNSGGVEHNVTFETGLSSGNRTSGSFLRTFQTVGTFAYVCTIHAAQGMSGVVSVTASSGGGGSGGDNGDGGGGGYP